VRSVEEHFAPHGNEGRSARRCNEAKNGNETRTDLTPNDTR